MLKKILKTTVAVATLMVGSQSWGATAYAPGSVESGNMRYDTVTLGTSGNFGAFTPPTAGVDTLYINIGIGAGSPAVGENTTTVMPAFPSSIKHIWFLGGHTDLSTALTSATKDYAFAVPPAGSTIHFNLSTAPGGDAYWFAGSIPSSCSIVVENGSQDPAIWAALGATINLSKFIIGSAILLKNTNTAINAMVSRHPDITEANAGANAKITLAGPIAVKKKVMGASFAGAHALTFEDDSTIVDPNPNVGSFVVAKGKKLTIVRNATTGAQQILGVNLGAKAKLEVIDK